MGLPLVAGTIPVGKPEEVGLSSDRLKRIGEAVQRHIDARDVAGAVTLVARKGRIAHFEARGMMDLEAKKPMPKDGLFRLASMSKPIAGVAIMMLVEEGKVRLNDPVSRFIPEFKGLDKVAVAKPGAKPAAEGGEAAYDVVSATRPITIGDLLKHGSGLVSGGPGASAAAAHRAAHADRHAGHLHSKACRGAARLPARHAVAIQRSGRLRRAEPCCRSGVGSDVRCVSKTATTRSARDEGHRLLSRDQARNRVSSRSISSHHRVCGRAISRCRTCTSQALAA